MTRKVLIALIAVVINVVVFLLIPVLQVLFGNPDFKKRERGMVERSLETLVRAPTQKVEKRQYKSIRANISSFKPSSAQNRMVKMDLSVSEGGEGVSVETGQIGAMTYMPGETDTEAKMSGGPPQPKTPLRARREGVAGFVDAQWVVNESGFVVELDILREDPPGYGFASEVRKWLKTTRWRPATLKKVPVRQLLKQRVEFDVQ